VPTIALGRLAEMPRAPALQHAFPPGISFAHAHATDLIHVDLACIYALLVNHLQNSQRLLKFKYPMTALMINKRPTVRILLKFCI
jgi:hypothetical protein